MELERYGHGGDIWTATETYGRPLDGWLDFSSNMNPWGPPEVIGRLMKEQWRDIARYPDPAVRSLRRKLSEVYRVPMESILVGNGAAELIDLVIRVLGPEETVIARPSFTEYEQAVRKAGRRIQDVFLRQDDLFDLKDAEPFASRTVFLGHPNNPTGRLIPQSVLERLHETETHLILDEAFMDFVPDESGHSFLGRAAESERIQVIRSMTKFYAMPGIRLGFLVAHPDIVRRLADQQTHWSVNFLAQLIGEAVLDETGYADRTRAWLLEERPWLIRELGRLGLRVIPGDVNYLLVSLPGDGRWNAKRLQRALAERGIMIRDASLFRGLDGSYFRIAIRLRPDNERLLKELKEVLA
ncbi:threonine-phosphate decarboxylase [Cohnella sp. CFH 77786]|uniref:threonine-phosphate decarboxylase CobD n=1 Tax=Cohnella sp. CFH 77786 TaxID=2662265 RepID=UPI001C60BED9|nr:threonine-phosphate decarboxylase CobD [Cohnella sp. CFH 77786]MBW5448014.1 threonine-phosphate decarboxylase [Cohnella sp. CFH 77786]